VLAARPERALRHFLQHVVTADGFDDFLLGIILAVILVVRRLVAERHQGMLHGAFRAMFVGWRGPVLFADMLFGGVAKRRHIVGMRGVFFGGFHLDALVAGQLFVRVVGHRRFCRGRDRCFDDCCHRSFGKRRRGRRISYGFGTIIVVVVIFCM